ncbi:hemicentin-1-like [Actinia tenebrosa]|uniref:Hemicentin-1-like n=1 Tax=Actinia tenebrosa TaxID=6105 RepID=A0A6P8HIT2_ACTTE|nr:hemicentin-1-like [Actinia tenebrosa]
MNTTLLVLCCLLTIVSSISTIEIIPPYPRNEIAIEGDSLAISCIARDTSGYPSKVIFTRRSRVDHYTYEEIQNSPRVYVTNTTRNDTHGLTRTAVLHIESAQPSDHSSLAPYQCWAYPSIPGGKEPEKHVFTIYVISKSDLPRATVTGANATLGDLANLTCDVTYPGNQYKAPLERLAWVKNTKTISENGSTTIDPLILTTVSARDGGVYTCMAVVKLQGLKAVNISLGTAILTIRVQFFEAPTEVVGTEGGRVVMECPAEGYPLNITWLRRLSNGTQVVFNDASEW